MINIYTDGSTQPNPGPGGWASILVLPGGEEIVLQGSEQKTTNNRMEFFAALGAMKWMDRTGQRHGTIWSDSLLLISTMEHWVWQWEKKRFRTKHKNLDIVQELHETRKRLTMQWRWVKGHNGHSLNERADKLADEARKRQIRHPVELLPGVVIVPPATVQLPLWTPEPSVPPKKDTMSYAEFLKFRYPLSL